MSGQPDAADWLYDRRMIPPEPEDYTWQPEPDSEQLRPLPPSGTDEHHDQH